MKYLIFCVETDKVSKIDNMYIDQAIKYRYEIGSNIKLIYIYLNGKGNYGSQKIINKINKTIKACNNNESIVIYCLDTDNYDSDPAIQKLNHDIEEFCESRHYFIIWFCKNIEEVFLHKRVEPADKKQEAIKFRSKEGLGKADINTLSSETLNAKKSNIYKCLDCFCC